jgi:sortase A
MKIGANPYDYRKIGISLIPVVIILIGISFLLYPVIKEKYRDNMDEKLVSEFEKSLEDNSDINIQEYDQLNEDTDQADDMLAQEGKTNVSVKAFAMLSVPCIDLKLPIMEGTTKQILDISGGHMIDTAMPGKEGNCAVAAHRSYTYGRFFNRLPEVTIGEVVTLTDKTGTYKYKVFNIERVLPAEVNVLNYNENDKILSMITCDPLKNPTHRLVVKAKLIE